MTDPLILGDCTLYLGDSMEVMPTLAAGSVDLIIADPPYPELKGGTVFMNGGVAPRLNESASIGDIWDADLGWMEEAWRVTRLGMMVFCSYHSVDTVKQKIRNNAIALVTWYKRNSPNPVNDVPKFETEYIWFFKKAPGLKWRKLRTHYDIPMLQAGCFATERILKGNNGTAAHPTQKPELLIRELLKCGPSNVLDPFLGTGTTSTACLSYSIPSIGIERNPTYFDIAVKRIKQAQLQMRLEI